MSPELPHEVWAHIASYIPDADLSKLYSLNRCFYELATDTKFKELRIAYHPTKGQLMKLHLARAPSVARRIRCLNINLLALHTTRTSSNERPSWKGRMQSMFSYLHDFVSGTRPKSEPAAVPFDELVDVGKHMKNVRHFYISAYPRHILGTQQNHLRHLWSSISESVHSLYLYMPGEALHLIPAILPNLSRVKHLSLDLYYNSLQWSESNSADAKSFLNTVAETLESLCLILYPVNTSRYLLFNNLDHFSKLKHVELYLSFSDMTYPGMTKFLNNHGGNITSLSLKLYCSTEIIPLSSLQLPSLRQLTLFILSSSMQLQRFLSGNLSFPSLDRLIILGSQLAQQDILSICAAFRESEFGHQLRDLRLDMGTLDSQIVDSLASTFSRLRTLLIRPLSLSRNVDPWNLNLFANEMETQRYPEWQLHDLTVERYESDSSLVFDPTSYVVMKIMAKSIPSLRSFCGNGHMEAPTATLPSFIFRSNIK